VVFWKVGVEKVTELELSSQLRERLGRSVAVFKEAITALKN
jgi:malate/lactate dehydrogenase